MWGGADEGKMKRRIFICWGFWPQRGIVSAGAGREGRESTGEGIWVVTSILLFTLSGFMMGHLNYNLIGMICRRVVTLLSVLVFPSD